MSGGLFGSTTTESSVPAWLEGPATEMLQRSVDLSKVGYQPYAGPQVAALDPAQVAAMQNTNDAAGAFGMNQAMPRIPNAQDFGNGTWGYSSLPLFDQQMAWLEQNRPGQKSFYDDFFVDPQTGQAGARMADPQTVTGLLEEIVRDYGGAGDQGYGGPGERGGGGGGYSGFGDMFDGGGPGQSGTSYGGALGGVSNAAGLSPDEGVGGIFGGWL